MLRAQRTIPFTEGQEEREMVVTLIKSGKLPLENGRKGEVDDKTITLGQVSLPPKYSAAARTSSIRVIQSAEHFEIAFVNHVSLFGDNPAYYIYNPDPQLARKSSFDSNDFSHCSGNLYQAEQLAPDWYFVACQW